METMSGLPTRWATTIIDGSGRRNAQYGIWLDLQAFKYALYVTDYTNVWIDRANKDQLIESAGNIGVEDLDNFKLGQLLNMLRNSIYDKSLATFTMVNDDLTVTLKTKEFSWKINLAQQLPEKCSQFMIDFNKQLVAVNDYLYYKIIQLNEVINSKDIYNKFLTENFKLSHGNDLIDTFKKNHRAKADDFTQFNALKWNKKTDKSYTTLHRSFWNTLGNCFQDKSAWKFANSLHLGNSNESRVVEPPSLSLFETIDNVSIKTEEDTTSTPVHSSISVKKEPQSTNIANEADLKFQPSMLPDSPQSSPIKSSPRKRLATFGTFASRKKRRSPP